MDSCDYVNPDVALELVIGGLPVTTFGSGSKAQQVYSSKDPGLDSHPSVNLAWGISVTMAIYVAGGVSGGYLNPAVTVAYATIGKLQWRKVPIYCLAQYLGAFAGAASVFGVYYDAHENFEGAERSLETAGIYATYPKEFVSITTGLGDQMLATALLLFCMLAIYDVKNTGVPSYMAPFLVGLLAIVISLSFGYNCGYAINPASDLAPRIFTAIAGWKTGMFKFRHYTWFWLPIVAPHIGAVLGAVVYEALVAMHLPEKDKKQAEKLDKVVPVTVKGLEDVGHEWTWNKATATAGWEDMKSCVINIEQ